MQGMSLGWLSNITIPALTDEGNKDMAELVPQLHVHRELPRHHMAVWSFVASI